MSGSTQQTPATYWLMVGDTPSGPFDTGQIQAKLAAGEIDWQTPACVMGASSWAPLLKTPGVGPEAPAGPPSPPPMAAATTFNSAYAPLLTNPRLPPMANLICIYAMAGAPAIWLFQRLCWIINPNFTYNAQSGLIWIEVVVDGAEKIVAIGVLAFLFMGGARLRDLRETGARFVKAGLFLWLIEGFGYFVLNFMMGALIGGFSSDDIYAEITPETSIQTVIDLFSMSLGLAELAFVIVSLIWLRRHQGQLGLDSSK